MSISTSIWIWIAALLTLMIYSFLYKDNPFYRLAEHIFMGLSLGYTLVILWYDYIIPRIYQPLFFSPHQWSLIFPILLGMMTFGIFSKKYNWLIKYPLAFYVSAFAAIQIPVMLRSWILKQVEASFLTPDKFSSVFNSINAILIFVGLVTTLIYFYFSKKREHGFGAAATVGIVFIMVAFGAAFGYTVMARISLLIGRMQFLIQDWLGIM
ncbi:hypothetical protein KAW18_06200 [candidate division WOR-3 bacterium]|nr:hypothetical protein [candidate division WOR-3 bacterium]